MKAVTLAIIPYTHFIWNMVEIVYLEIIPHLLIISFICWIESLHFHYPIFFNETFSEVIILFLALYLQNLVCIFKCFTWELTVIVKCCDFLKYLFYDYCIYKSVRVILQYTPIPIYFCFKITRKSSMFQNNLFMLCLHYWIYFRNKITFQYARDIFRNLYLQLNRSRMYIFDTNSF